MLRPHWGTEGLLRRTDLSRLEQRYNKGRFDLYRIDQRNWEEEKVALLPLANRQVLVLLAVQEDYTPASIHLLWHIHQSSFPPLGMRSLDLHHHILKKMGGDRP